MQTCCYFAYGSNLLHARLQARTPSLKNIGIGKLHQHKMTFNMPGGDGSGKCGIVKTAGDDYVIGVLYQLDLAEKLILDEIESTGYLYQHYAIEVEYQQQIIAAYTYYPTDMSCRLQPYDWYKNFVLLGAKENNFPADYIQMIEAVEAQIDPDTQRRKDNFQIANVSI